MMKLSLGSALLALFLCVSVYGNASLRVDTPAIYKGEVAEFSIVADGEDVEFPQISQVNGVAVLGVKNSQSISMINGKVSKQTAKTYRLKPEKALNLPAYSVKIDGKTYTTNEAKIEVLEPEKSKEGDEFVLELKFDKNELYVGESTKLSVIFKRKINANISKAQLENINLNNFWIRKLGDNTQSREGDYIVEKMVYLVFAQKSGEYEVSPLAMDIAKAQSRGGDPFFDMFMSDLQWQKIYSNPLKISVKPLPGGVENFGKFSISAYVDKNETNANEPVNLTIEIDGDGNIDDVKKFNLNFGDAMVYNNEPSIKSGFKDGKYGGKFTQKFAIVSDQNFTIPSVSFSYFDEDLGAVKTVKSNKIKIYVKNAPAKSASSFKEANLQTPTKKTEQNIINAQENPYVKWLNLAVGFVLGALTFYLFTKFKFRKKQEKSSSVLLKIKAAKSDKELFTLLLPYANDSKVIKNTLCMLEENLYKNAKNIIDKKSLLEYFDDEESKG
ncbi:BatD family protein [Campylobacter geochelonis]|nr:BatD family protein [Campylobacter geochelonis]QKF70942.1 putative aerotolerance protein BatD [Campylobacter geochelonis]